MDELIALVQQWAKDKGLDSADPHSQYLKVAEETGEIAAALARNDMEELEDAIGDTLVTLIILSQQVGLDPVNCLQAAYDVISKRTGKLVNGVFVKDSDLTEDTKAVEIEVETVDTEFSVGDIVYLKGGKNPLGVLFDNPGNPLEVLDVQPSYSSLAFYKVYEAEEDIDQLVLADEVVAAKVLPPIQVGDRVQFKDGVQPDYCNFSHPDGELIVISMANAVGSAFVTQLIDNKTQMVDLNDLVRAGDYV